LALEEEVASLRNAITRLSIALGDTSQGA
jgi:hypothetical protein